MDPEAHAVRPRASTPPIHRILSPLLVLLLWVAPVLASDPLPYGQGVLWRIDGAGPSPSYVFGTIHVTDPRVHDLPDTVAAVLGSVDSLTVEVHMTPAATAAMAGAMIMHDGPPLDTVLAPEAYSRLSDIATQYGIPAGVINRLAPWGAAAAIALPPGEHRRMVAGDPILDRSLQAHAEARGIPVHALETIEEQIDALSGLPHGYQVTMLQQMIDVHDTIDTLFETMIGLYLERDLAAVQAWMVDQSAGGHEALLTAFLDRMVYVRNLRMAQRMTPRLADGNALIAIGALHLPGDRGVLALLAGRGYAVERVY